MNTKTASSLLAAGAMTAALALASTSSVVAEGDDMEHCFGVAKAGQNDCKSSVPGSTCQGSSKVDNDPNAYINVPVGTCAKIVGGSTEPQDT